MSDAGQHSNCFETERLQRLTPNRTFDIFCRRNRFTQNAGRLIPVAS
jgi:hypothetical protein